MWHSRQVSATTFPYLSLFTKSDDSAKTVPVECLLDGHVFGLFVPLPPAFLMDFPREQTFRWKRVLAELSFSVLCSSCFIHGTKTP